VTSITVALRSRTFSSLRRHRNYRLFFVGQIVSQAGAGMQDVALAWLVLKLSREPLAVAALMMFRFAPFTLFGLFAGSIVDRLDTRRLVMWMQLAAMLVSIALAAVTLTGSANLPVVYVLAALGGIVMVLEMPSRQTLTFELVGARELPNALALNSGLGSIARVVGPALAGVMIASVGIDACFIVNAISFLAVLAALALMRKDELHRTEKDASANVFRSSREGFHFAIATPEIRAVLAVVTITALMGFNLNTVVALLASDTLHLEAGTFGLLSAAAAVGAVLGALVTASLRRASWRGFSTGAIAFNMLILALAPVTDVWLVGLILGALGGSFVLFMSTANTLIQLITPDNLRGRVVSLYLFAYLGLAPLGGLLAGWLTTVGGTELAFALAGLMGLATLAVARPRSVKEVIPAEAV
jgi:MFS family permease